MYIYIRATTVCRIAMLLQFSLATVPILPIGASINSVKTQDCLDLRVIILSFLSEKQRTSIDQSQGDTVLENKMLDQHKRGTF